MTTPLVVVNAVEAAIAIKNGHPVYEWTGVIQYAPTNWNVPSGAVTPPLPGLSRIIFEDAFTTLDPNKWSLNWFGDGGVMNNVGTYKANVSVGPNGLALGLSAPGRGSLISTVKSAGAGSDFTFTYGYVEFEATFPNNNDWCSGWMSDLKLPGAGEFDIAEQMGAQISSNYHYAGPTADNDPSPLGGLLGVSHVFGLHWTPGSAVFYVDGQVHRTITGPEIVATPQYLIFNHGASSPSDSSGVGSEFVVKYVRVWQ